MKKIAELMPVFAVVFALIMFVMYLFISEKQKQRDLIESNFAPELHEDQE